MRFSGLLLFSAGCSLVSCQSTIEAPNFNVTDALLDLGVNVSALPDLAPLAERSSLAGCSIACSSLQLLFGSQLLQQNTAAYQNFTGSYWSQQQEQVDPYCIFQPTKPEQVSIQILLSRLTQCPFAIKSGGHAAFAGASSIEGGITLSLQNFNQIVPSSDKLSAAIGPGNRWHDVYVALQPQDIVVIGGRVSAIGVGGLTLGGGISFFSNIYGWACDNVIEYQVVTASGIILNVNQKTYPDLYWALRGGGNNYGVVTSFKVNTIPLPQGLMWGGSRVSLNTSGEFPQLIKAFYDLGTTGATSDPNAAQILSFTSYQGLNLASAALEYAKPVANPPIFNEFYAIPTISDTTSVRTLAAITDEFAASNPDGRREQYWAVAYKLTIPMTTFVTNVFYEELPTVVNASGIVPAATLQVITDPQIAAMQKNGGNALGLTPDEGPLLLLNMNVQWDSAADDARITAFNSRIIQRTVEYAKQNGLYNEYLYMNYASQYQDVIASYGAANKARLISIAKKYDPTGVFQELNPGYFKLDGPPA